METLISSSLTTFKDVLSYGKFNAFSQFYSSPKLAKATREPKSKIRLSKMAISANMCPKGQAFVQIKATVKRILKEKMPAKLTANIVFCTSTDIYLKLPL